MQIVSRKVTIQAMARLRETNPAAAELLSLAQLHHAIEYGVTTVMSGPDAPQPQHGKILAAAAQALQIVQRYQRESNTQSLRDAGTRAGISWDGTTVLDEIQAAFADTDPVALSELLKENGNGQ